MTDYIVECKNLKKYYGKNKVLDGINLKIETGKIVGILGQNGCGKTTLFKILNGLIGVTEGEILINGMKPSLETKKIVAYLPDKNCLGQFKKVREAVNFFEDFFEDFDKEMCTKMLTKFNISLDEQIDIQSKGNLEKLQLLIVMSRKAKLYLLDEPLAAVDVVTREEIVNTILTNYHSDSTILIITHLIRDIETIFDDVVFIKNGKIEIESSVEKIRNEQGKSITALFKEVYKC